jgi:glycerophosphoryl diester phosphodiesterase
MKTISVAHRGAISTYPENTLSAFKAALKGGYPAVECDVQLTSDGELVVIHDGTVDRTTSGSGWVSRLTADRIRSFQIEGGERVPFLDEVVQLVVRRARRKLVIEIKGDTEQQASRVGKALALYISQLPSREVKKLEVHSFWYEALEEFKVACPQAVTAAIINGGFTSEQIISFAKQVGAEGVSLGHEFVSSALVRACHNAGLFVDTWAISDAAVMRRLRPFGVNAVIENFTGTTLR